MDAGRVDIVFTGADRIARNGDTANKIGTYGLAVSRAIRACRSTPPHRRPPSMPRRNGDEIPVEERAASENTSRFPALNPAFDVTPAELIDAVVTEEGVRRLSARRMRLLVLAAGYAGRGSTR